MCTQGHALEKLIGKLRFFVFINLLIQNMRK